MRMLQVVRRPWWALALLVGLTACGGDSSEPSAPYDPAGTSGDLAVANAAFEGPAMESFVTASAYMQAVVGATPASFGAAAIRLGQSGSPTAGAKAYAQLLRGSVAPSGDRPQFSTASIPAELHGTTFVLEADGAGYTYVESGRTGAPSNGVRFVLYAVNPLNGDPVLDQEIGYADLTGTSGTSSATAHLTVVSNGVTYLDYTASVTATSSGGRITTTGFVTNGTDRANFTLINLINVTETGGTVTTDWSYDVPSRDLSLDFGMTITLSETEDAAITLDLRVNGPHGSVTMAGNISSAGSGQLTVKTNGTTYAIITFDGAGQYAITGPAGETLGETDLEAVNDLVDFYEGSFDGFSLLLWPSLLLAA